MGIRVARASDVPQMLEIYRASIEGSPISFEYTTPSQQEFELRVTSTLKTHPWLVFESEGEIAGYAYASTHRSRCAYDWSVESSVYIAKDFYRQGMGRKLYSELFAILKKQGFVNVFAGVTLPNASSVGLHEAMGFKRVGIYRNIGFKLDKWWDVGWWQLQLQSPEKPKALIPFADLQMTC